MAAEQPGWAGGLQCRGTGARGMLPGRRAAGSPSAEVTRLVLQRFRLPHKVCKLSSFGAVSPSAFPPCGLTRERGESPAAGSAARGAGRFAIASCLSAPHVTGVFPLHVVSARPLRSAGGARRRTAPRPKPQAPPGCSRDSSAATPARTRSGGGRGVCLTHFMF